jgi:hypothetical protein
MGQEFAAATARPPSPGSEGVMRRVLLAAVAVLTLSSVGVDAQDQMVQQGQGSSCLQWPVAMIAAQANNPDAQLLRTMEGHLAHDFVSIVNQMPPVSTFDGDHVALFFRKSDENFLVVIGQNECARHVVELPASIFQRMLGQET